MRTDINPLRQLALLIPCTFLLLAASSAIYGQSSGIGDPAVASGNPSSSYDLSAVDHINYYNGLVSITIPTYTVGGRGSASVVC